MKRLFATGCLCVLLIPCAYGDTSESSRISIAIPIVIILVMALIFWVYSKRKVGANDPENEISGIDVALTMGDMEWATRATEEIEALDRNDPQYEDKKWFLEQIFLFATDRTMHHPNPGIPEDKKIDWKIPTVIDRSKFVVEDDEEGEKNPYMHPLMITCKVFGNLGDEKQLAMYEDLSNAVEEYMKGEISFLDFYVVREMVYREIPNFARLYDEITDVDFYEALVEVGLSKMLRKKSPGKKIEKH